MFITFDTNEATQKDWKALDAFVTVQLGNTLAVEVHLSDEAVEEQVRKHAETLVDELNEGQENEKENGPKSYDDLTYDELKKLAKLRGIDTGSRRSAGIREMLREVDAKDDAAEDPQDDQDELKRKADEVIARRKAEKAAKEAASEDTTEVEEVEVEVLEEDELKRKADEVIARRKAEKAAKEAASEDTTEVEEVEVEVLEEDEKDGEDGEDGEDGPTLADATAIATELVSKGKSNVVKAALNDLGVKRVSQLDPSDIAEFIQIVKG